MNIRTLVLPMMCAPALMLSACAQNYAVEGAGVGAVAGAAAGAITGGDVLTGAAIGAAAGGIGGALIERDGRCYRTDRDGREYVVDCRHRN